MNVLTVLLLVLVCLCQLKGFQSVRCVGGTHPVEYGETWPLSCTKKNGRRKRDYDPPSVWVHKLTHRWLNYQGYYYEFGPNGAWWRTGSAEWSHCNQEPEWVTRSDVDTKCLQGCARNYRRYHGEYRVLTNNCHHFVNVLGNVLCTTRKGYCPAWCMSRSYGLEPCWEKTDW